MTTIDTTVTRAASVVERYTTVRYAAPRRSRFTNYCIALLVIADFCAVMGGILLAYGVYKWLGKFNYELWDVVGAAIIVATATFFAFRHFRLYDLIGGVANLRKTTAIARGLGLIFVGVVLFLFLWGQAVSSRYMVVLAVAGVSVAVLMLRNAAYLAVRWAYEHGHGLRHVLIYGADCGSLVFRKYARNPRLGVECIGFVDDNEWLSGESFVEQSVEDRLCRASVLGGWNDIPTLIESEQVDEIVVADASIPRDRFLAVMRVCEESHLGLSFTPDVFGKYQQWFGVDAFDGSSWAAPVDVGGLRVFASHQREVEALARATKRFFDVVFAGASLIALAPVFAAIAVAIMIDSRGPVFYRSLRVGIKGHFFVFYKFRSMVANADDLKDDLRDLNERTGLLFKIKDDPRITRIGRVLRKYSLDELPQLWNVLIGNMSMVGPRPPSLDEYEQYSREHLSRLAVYPGITGMWQIYAREHPSFDKAVALDLQYIRNWSPWLDLKILLKTVPLVLKGNGC